MNNQHNIWWFRILKNPTKVWTVVRSHNGDLLLFTGDEPKGYYQPTSWVEINKLEHEGKIMCYKAGQHCKHCLKEEVAVGLCTEHIKVGLSNWSGEYFA